MGMDMPVRGLQISSADRSFTLILQSIQYSDNGDNRCTELFLHRENGRQVYDGYYNMFAAGKWVHYTSVNHLYVTLCSTGPGSCQIRSKKGCLLELPLKKEGTCEVFREEGSFHASAEIPDWKDASYLWIEWMPQHTNDTLEGCFYTEDIPMHPVRMAVAICTYHREAYVERNIRLLREHILDDPKSPVYDKLDLFLTDNGQTLDASAPLYMHAHIRLVKNKNAGGSGGFSRGMLEVLEQKSEKRFTHIILMDDDVVITPECFVRTYALLSFLQDAFRDSCIGGELLDIDLPYLLNEAGALYNKGLSEIPLRGTDLRNREQVIEAEKIRHSDYAGWWYACYPLTVVREDNLPLPLFIHFDDIEYGLRNHNGVIYLNGISVRHAGFTQRYSQANTYYTIRNRLITNALRAPEVTFGFEHTYMKNAVLYELLRCFYSNVELIALAVEDYCKGAKGLGKTDPVLKNEQVRSLTERFRPFEEIADDAQMLEKLNAYADRCAVGEGYQPKVGKTTYRFTLNGWLLPAESGVKVGLCSLYHPDMRELYRCRKGILVDPYARKGLVVEKSFRKFLKALLTYCRVSNLMKKRYTAAAENYRKYEKVLESSPFWREYLDQTRNRQTQRSSL